MQRPAVSIITAAYNSDPAHLQLAIASAVGQTCGDLEIIVSDDSPTDRLRELVYAFSDGRLSYRHNVPALGAARNHWQCLEEARGEYAVILNHDDVLEPSFIARLLPALEGDSALALAFCDHWIIDQQGKRQREETESASRRYGRQELAAGLHAPFFDLLLKQSVPMAMGTLFRRSALLDPPPDVAGPAYDLWLAYLLCRHGMGAWYVPERLSSWRSHPANQTSAGDISLLRGSALCWEKLADDGNAGQWRAAARDKAAGAYAACATWHYRHRRLDEARRDALRSISMRWSARAAVWYALSCLPFQVASGQQ